MTRRLLFPILCAAVWLSGVTGVAAAPDGTLTIAMHFSPVTRWLDPAEGESTITPYLLLYALHDGLLKPMPGAGSTPSLAESWSMSKDVLSAEFTLRRAKFHNGEPVTAEDVRFSFERYRGGAAKVLKDAVKEIQTPAPNRVRFETLGLSRPTGSIVPRDFEFALALEPHPYNRARARQLLAEAGYPGGFDGGELAPFPPYNSMGETIQGWLQAVGIRMRVRTMERGAFMTAWREKKLRGVVLTISGVSGNAATRLESFVTRGGAFAFGSLPEVDDLFRRQAAELDRKKREALLFQLQRVLYEQVTQAPVYHLGFPIGVGPRVDDIMATAIPGFYMSPYEDLKLRR